jgi:hypothetical protein
MILDLFGTNPTVVQDSDNTKYSFLAVPSQRFALLVLSEERSSLKPNTKATR